MKAYIFFPLIVIFGIMCGQALWYLFKLDIPGWIWLLCALGMAALLGYYFERYRSRK